jgi:mannose-1-phosphate guanylyltransferase
MRAILLASGYGKRLRPITDVIPKCLVPIKGIPLLKLWLERLTKYGIGPFLINTHYLSEQVEIFVTGSGYIDQVTLSYEPDLLGTAGTLLSNKEFFKGEDGLLIHADNYCQADLKAFIRAHHARPSECVMTMMTFHTDNPSSCGIVILDQRGVVIEFHEKTSIFHGDVANAAIYCISSEMIKSLALDYPHAKDFSNDVLPHFVGKIFTYQTTEILVDIGTPEAYKSLNEQL